VKTEIKLAAAAGLMSTCFGLTAGVAILASKYRQANENFFLYECITDLGMSHNCLYTSIGPIHVFDLTRNLNSNQVFANWSPDGNTLVYTELDNSTNQTSSLFVKDLEGGNRKILAMDSIVNPQWVISGQDSNKIIFVGRGVNGKVSTPQIYTVDRDGQNVDQITNFPNDLQVINVNMSPNGIDFITTTIENKTNRIRLFFSNLNNRNVYNEILPENDSDKRDEKFSPDGKQLALIVQDDIKIINLSNNTVNDLKIEASTFNWSPDGSQIIFSFTGGIYIFSLGTQEISHVIDTGPNIFTDPFLAKDGYIYYLVNPDGYPHFMRVRPDGSDNQFVTNTTATFSSGYIVQIPNFPSSK
jgi:Tol biopolymer transport system component